MPKLLRVTTSPLSLRSLLSNQMKYMKDNGFEVIMVSSDGKEWPDLLKNEQCEHRTVPMSRNIAPFKDLLSLWRMYRLIKREKPDIVHSHTPKAGLLAMLASRMAGVKIRIHTIAGLRFVTTTGMLKRILVFMERITGRAATNVWPNSYSLLRYIKTHKLAMENKLQVIGHGSSNGVDLRRFSTAALLPGRLQEIKNLLQYDEKYTYLLNMGRIVKDKGINELMPVFETLYLDNNQLRMIILGHFEDKLDPISEQARKTLTTHPGIIHIDWNENVEYFMHLSLLMVHASYREGFPNTLLQSGALNCPIVCSAIEGNVDVVTDKETGILFKAGDAKDLLEKLRWALLHGKEMKTYAVNLRLKIENNFSQDYVHQCLKEKYVELLS